MGAFRRIICILAAFGFASSLVWHVYALYGALFPSVLGSALFAGIFVVFIPTVLYLQRFQRVLQEGAGINAWRYILRGAPAWMVGLVVASFGYAFINFFLATGMATGTVTDKNPAWDRVASGHSMVFYSIAMVVMIAALAQEEEDLDLRCEQGHEIPYGAAFCERCGAPARKAIPDDAEKQKQ